MSDAMQQPNWDVFISHASEDKETVARPLAEALARRGVKVWFDAEQLTLGDSLRRSIDQGLAQSRYGIVILSRHFFAKEWPMKELDGLVAREDGKEKVILPVWHEITEAEVKSFSPMLADKLAVSTSEGLDSVVDKILRAIFPNRPVEPELIHIPAGEHLLEKEEKKPEIQLRLAPGEPSSPQITNGEILPAKTIALSRAMSSGDFSLVVENVGNVPAKSVTIQIQHEPSEADSSSARVRPKAYGSFRIEQGLLVFRGDDKFRLNPQELWMANFEIGLPSHSGLFLLVRDVARGEHLLHCTVWAEGTRDESFRFNEELTITIVD